MSLRLDSKVAVVTGGAMGIGAATAQRLCELGATVAVLDRNVDAAQATVKELLGAGHVASAHACEVNRESSVREAIDQVVQRYGALHILVSNAGIQRYGDVVGTSSGEWDEVFDVHVKGCFHASRYAIPAMLKSGGGAIVIVGSVQCFTAVQNSAAYVSAKHALLGLTRAMGLDYARQNIRVNCVCPGTIDTPMMRASAAATPDPEGLMAACARMHPMGRIGSPLEVANAIAFLASDWASFITGAALLVDGGLMVPAGGMGLQEAGLGASKR